AHPLHRHRVVAMPVLGQDAPVTGRGTRERGGPADEGKADREDRQPRRRTEISDARDHQATSSTAPATSYPASWIAARAALSSTPSPTTVTTFCSRSTSIDSTPATLATSFVIAARQCSHVTPGTLYLVV